MERLPTKILFLTLLFALALTLSGKSAHAGTQDAVLTVEDETYISEVQEFVKSKINGYPLQVPHMSLSKKAFNAIGEAQRAFGNSSVLYNKNFAWACSDYLFLFSPSEKLGFFDLMST